MVENITTANSNLKKLAENVSRMACSLEDKDNNLCNEEKAAFANKTAIELSDLVENLTKQLKERGKLNMGNLNQQSYRQYDETITKYKKQKKAYDKLLATLPDDNIAKKIHILRNKGVDYVEKFTSSYINDFQFLDKIYNAISKYKENNTNSNIYTNLGAESIRSMFRKF